MNYNCTLKMRRILKLLLEKQKREKSIVFKKGRSIIIRVIYFFYNIKMRQFGSFIPPAADIGENVVFVHSLFGVFISENAVIGDNCIIYHHVTIGSVKNDKGINVAPIIGENTLIGANATIVGKTIIGKNCKIGAGTVIANGKIPDNSTVISCKYKVIEKLK